MKRAQHAQRRFHAQYAPLRALHARDAVLFVTLHIKYYMIWCRLLSASLSMASQLRADRQPAQIRKASGLRSGACVPEVLPDS